MKDADNHTLFAFQLQRRQGLLVHRQTIRLAGPVEKLLVIRFADIDGRTGFHEIAWRSSSNSGSAHKDHVLGSVFFGAQPSQAGRRVIAHSRPGRTFIK